MKDLTSGELATVMAALRHWQITVTNNSSVLAHSVPMSGVNYFDDGSRDGVAPLTSDEIDALCARLVAPRRAPGRMAQHHIYGDPKCPCPRCQGSNPAYAEVVDVVLDSPPCENFARLKPETQQRIRNRLMTMLHEAAESPHLGGITAPLIEDAQREFNARQGFDAVPTYEEHQGD